MGKKVVVGRSSGQICSCNQPAAGDTNRKPLAPSVLVVSVASAAVVMKLGKGIAHLSQSDFDVGWAIITHDAPDSGVCPPGDDLKEECDFTRHRKTLIRFARAHNTSLSILSGMNLSQSKLPLQRQPELLELSQGFSFVWLTDSDIDFHAFDLGRFFRYHQAAGNPLISQPLIRQNTQSLTYGVNAAHWVACDWEQTQFAAATFIEQQAPLLDSGFFRWFMNTKAVSFLSDYQRALPTDWGVDHLWCGAAMLYSARTHQQQRMPCAIIMVPISHVQKNESNADRFPRNDNYVNRGRHTIALTFKAAGFHGEDVQHYALWTATSTLGCASLPCLNPGESMKAKARHLLPELTVAVRNELATFIHGQIYVCNLHAAVLNNPWVRAFAEITC